MIWSRTLERKWICRYKTFFIVGLLILLFQVYLACRFFSLNNETSHEPSLFPFKANVIDIIDEENSVNIRKIKDGVISADDDEDSITPKPAKRKALLGTGKTTNKTNLVLRLEELDFVPSCEITTREAISAIHRAKTQTCKRFISNITCQISQGAFYPQTLPSYCPHNGFTFGKALGCFKDEKSFRLLNGYYGKYEEKNSPEFCLQLCLQSGFIYAGVQYSSECFCGNDAPPSKVKLPDSSCNMKCPNPLHSTAICGGYYAINIYETGISKFTAQIAETSTPSPGKSVRIVFLLTLNGRALRQVKRLIKILYHRKHFFYIHVDVRQDYLFRELLPLETTFPNIRLTRRRFSTIWGGASLLQMLISCMRELLALPWQWDFVINLSESDYPVKTVQRVEAFLAANPRRNFVKSHGRDVQRFIQKQGLDKTFVECEHRMWRVGDRRLPAGVQIDGGSDWVALSRDFVAYATTNDVEAANELLNGLLTLFNYTLLPAESFFHTLLRNSHFCTTYVDNNLHVTNWKRKLGCKCQYKHIVDWCGCSPNDFRPDDWLRIQNTENKQIYFARKFEPIVNQAVIFQLEQWLMFDGGGGVDVSKRDGTINQHAYWQSIYHHLDLKTTSYAQDHAQNAGNEDALRTLAHSVFRLEKHCKTSTKVPSAYELVEATSFHYDDHYAATLMRFRIGPVSASSSSSYEEYELKLKPKTHFHVIKSTTMSRRIRSLVVNTDYDQKEQIFRNFVQIFGPYSQPVLVYQIDANPELNAQKPNNNNNNNLTFLWVDPNGRIADVEEASVDDLFVASHVKPAALAQPLLAGAWSVRVVHRASAIAETQFLITPMEYVGGTRVTESQYKILFNPIGTDPQQRRRHAMHRTDFAQYEQYLPKRAANKSLPLIEPYTENFSIDLQQWIDRLVAQFYDIGRICMIGLTNAYCNTRMPRCAETEWSSKAPDPKSYIGNLNVSTGRFDLW